MVTGPDANDKEYADALKKSAKKIQYKNKKEKFGILQQISEERQVKKFLFLRKVKNMMFW